MFDFKEQLKALPENPGVYLMKNYLGKVIYVGKAKILKNRVKQYFMNSKNHSRKVKAMIKNICEFEYIITDSEIEALILECNLIKKYRPKYNILLKDDKQYPFIKVTVTEDFPRIFVTRNLVNDGAKYFGPYTDVSMVYETIELLKKIFPIRSCRKVIKEEKFSRPCLNYHIGLCKAPCANYIKKEEYNKIIKNVLNLLNGKDKSIIRILRTQMEEASENLEFEKAANIRDKLLSIKKITEKQKIVVGNFSNEDFINFYSDEEDTCIQIFFLRNGKIMGREHFILQDTIDMPKEKIISDFIKEFYGGTAFIPKNIYIPKGEDIKLLEQWLNLKKGSKVYIKQPIKGYKKSTLELVKKNAKFSLNQFKINDIKDNKVEEKALEEISHILNLRYIPKRIEAYDISNIQGFYSVGSMVVFENGKPKKSDYRKFKIKEVKGPNDYYSIKEVLFRRFKRGIDEVKNIQNNSLDFNLGKFCIFPDIILIDGGKGQINIVIQVLKKFNINIPVCGMVKDNKHNTRGLIYKNQELNIPLTSYSMKLITKIQDEVHRFAISYHRNLRNKGLFNSILKDIPYIGEKRSRELLKNFGSIENIKNATYKELKEVNCINDKAAKSILNYFKRK